PTLCKEHLISVLEKLESLNGNLLFILETNGILLGAEEEYSKELSSFRNLHVRVSFKAADEKRFSELTGASEKGFGFQLKALKNLEKYKVSCHPSLMISFSEPKKIESFRDTLRKISKRFEEFEIEEVLLYPEVLKRLKEKKYSWLK
ncbi:MAG: molybdenum cofactor biosynthesis protein MoaA, partial [archaeon]